MQFDQNKPFITRTVITVAIDEILQLPRLVQNMKKTFNDYVVANISAASVIL